MLRTINKVQASLYFYSIKNSLTVADLRSKDTLIALDCDAANTGVNNKEIIQRNMIMRSRALFFACRPPFLIVVNMFISL